MSNTDPNKLFVTDGSNSSTYGDLNRFAAALQHRLSDPPPMILVPGLPETGIILTIASCYLLDLPVLVFRPDQIEAALTYAPEGSLFIKPDSISESTQIPGGHLPSLNPDKLDLKADPKIKTGNFDFNKPVLTLFTSGTTGEPKPVHITRRQLSAAVSNSADNFRPAPGELWLLCLPLNHMGGLGVIYRSLAFGSGIYLSGGFDVGSCAGIIEQNHEVCYISLVPTQLKRLLPFINPENHNLKAALIGGGPISGKLLQQAWQMNVPAIGSYGMTETCGQIAAQPLKNRQQFPAHSAGRIFSGNRIEIRDFENSRPLSAGKTGVIFLHGNQIPEPKLNPHLASRFDDKGWFATSDIGKVDSEGNIFIEGRRDDVILTGGENVIPLQVEQALSTLESTGEATVVGMPDEEWGQRVVAVITGREPGSEEIDRLLRPILPSYALPKEWIRVDELPRNEMGKVDRRRVRQIINQKMT